MTYHVNEIFYSLQGEGYWTGRPAVFVRFSRCNLWTGREADRHRAVCRFCDTDFQHSDPYTLNELVTATENAWTAQLPAEYPMLVLTGGEPLLQVDAELTAALGNDRFYIAVETNGTQPIPPGIDWVCVSPKQDTTLKVHQGNELKVVFPQPRLDLDELAELPFDHYWLSPMDGPDLHANTAAAIDYCLAHPQWRLNIQTHKVIGMR